MSADKMRSGRQLNPELFQFSGLNIEDQASSHAVLAESKKWESVSLATEMRVVELTRNLETMQFHAKTLEEQIIRTQDQVLKLTKGLQNGLQKQEQFRHEIMQMIQTVKVRQGTQNQVEMRVQEMLDKHNSVLKKYETRMSQMEQLIHEKQQESIAYRAALREAREELTRLKRG